MPPIPEHIAWVYILTNEATTVLYTGYTTDQGQKKAWKIELINSMNPRWNDLTEQAKNL